MTTKGKTTKLIPSKLYKYTPYNTYSLRILTHSEVYFAPYSKLNDLAEYKAGFDFNLEESEPVQPHFLQVVDKLKQVPEALRGTLIAEMTDAMDQAMTNATREATGVCCFSEVMDSQLMFAHYAQNTGMCLEFATSDELFPQHYLTPVDYLETYEPVKALHADSQELAMSHWSRKPASWEYEKEWRIFGKADTTDKFDEKALTAIYFGPRADDKDIQVVITLTASRKIPIFKMTLEFTPNPKFIAHKIN